MKAIHITPSSNGYEIVELLANRVSDTNGFAVIKKDDGEIYYTGGFIITDTPEIRAVLDAIEPKKQYKFVMDFKNEPFVASHYPNG